MDTDKPMTFGRWLKLLRESRNIRQGKLAELAGIKQSVISLLESNKLDPSARVILGLTDAFKLDVAIFRKAAQGDYDMSVITLPEDQIKSYGYSDAEVEELAERYSRLSASDRRVVRLLMEGMIAQNELNAQTRSKKRKKKTGE